MRYRSRQHPAAREFPVDYCPEALGYQAGFRPGDPDSLAGCCPEVPGFPAGCHPGDPGFPAGCYPGDPDSPAVPE